MTTESRTTRSRTSAVTRIVVQRQSAPRMSTPSDDRRVFQNIRHGTLFCATLRGQRVQRLYICVLKLPRHPLEVIELDHETLRCIADDKPAPLTHSFSCSDLRAIDILVR